MGELFKLKDTAVLAPKVPIMCACYLPVRCKKCESTVIPDSNQGLKECPCCDGEMESILWHEYAESLKQYKTPCPNGKITKIANELQAEYEKTLKYIEFMGAKVNGSGVIDKANKAAMEIVKEFEEDEL